MNVADIDWESIPGDWRTGDADDEHIKLDVVKSTLAVWARPT